MYNSVSIPNWPITLPNITLNKIWKVKANKEYKIKSLKYSINTKIVLLTLNGKGVIKTKHKIIYAKEKQMLTLNGSEILSYKCYDNNWSFYWFEILDINKVIKPSLELYFSNPILIALECDKCFHELSSKINSTLAFSRFYLMYLSIIDENKNTTYSYYEEIVDKAKQYINEHINSDISISDIAQYCSISDRYLNKIFNNVLNISPKKYILNKKFDLAIELLQHTSMTISYIAQSLGFSDNLYFTRIFKKYIGCTPSAFKKQSATHY